VYVILGNSALLKCEIPSFVADFVSVVSWSDNQGQEYFNTQSTLGTKNSQNKGDTQAILIKLVLTISVFLPFFQLYHNLILLEPMKFMSYWEILH
jgi:hypothetical protein